MTTLLPEPTLDISDTAPTPFGRLVKVEARKMVDTRSGFWLLTLTGVLLVLTMGIALLVAALNDDAVITASNWVTDIVLLPVSLLLPVFAVLVVTNEWSQRTHLVTFSLEPRRVRVILAKLTTVCLLAVITIALAVALGVIGNVLYGVVSPNPVVWDLDATRLATTVGVQVVFFLMGFGFGLLLLNTPAAVSVFYLVGFLLPMLLFSTLFFMFGWARDVLPWVDLTTATMPFVTDTHFDGSATDIGAREWAQAGVTTLLWVVLPVSLGMRRTLRAEAK